MATRSAPLFYLDALAIVKLVVRETETDALLSYLEGAEVVSTEVATIEVARAAHIKTGAEETVGHAEEVMSRFYLVPCDEEIRSVAARARPLHLRSLDALHLAAALRVRNQIDAVVAYDGRLQEACRNEGFRVDAPAPETANPAE